MTRNGPALLQKRRADATHKYWGRFPCAPISRRNHSDAMQRHAPNMMVNGHPQ